LKNRIGRCAVALAAAALAFAPLLAHAAAPSADDYYRDALAQMRSITEPAYLTYQTSIPSGHSSIVLGNSKDGRAQLGLLISNRTQPAQSWSVSYRSRDGEASIAVPGGHEISQLAFFDPTWRGAYTWMRHGLEATLVDANASPGPAAASPAPASSPSPLPVIAMVTAIGPGYYRAEDGGAVNCADGRPGHHLHMVARTDPKTHPLTDVVIDTQTMRFCSMRFHESLGNALLGMSFDVDLHFGTVDGYYVITNGAVVGVGKALLVPALHLATAFRYDGTQTPASLPDALFQVQPPAAPSTKPSV
jgi:hypothetical protein